jgi:hypothetical protein
MLDVDRRKQPRVPWNGDVAVQVGTQRVFCEGADISETGMQLLGDWGAYPGQSVTLKFEVGGHAVHAFGTVEWATINDVDHVWGIRFTALHPRVRARIAKLVERQRDTLAEPIAVVPGTPQPGWTQHPTPVGYDEVMFEPGGLDDLAQYADTNRMYAEPASFSEDTPAQPEPVVPVRTGETVIASLDQIQGRPQPASISPSTAIRVDHRRRVEDVLRHVSDAHEDGIRATPGRRNSRSGTVER